MALREGLIFRRGGGGGGGGHMGVTHQGNEGGHRGVQPHGLLQHSVNERELCQVAELRLPFPPKPTDFLHHSLLNVCVAGELVQSISQRH